MSGNLLANGGFDAGDGAWPALVIPASGDPFWRTVPEVASPDGWHVWFREGKYKGIKFYQPETRLHRYPERVYSGKASWVSFGFCRCIFAGLYQTVEVAPGALVSLSAMAHAWSNNPIDDWPLGFEDCGSDGTCSIGAGRAAVAIDEADLEPESGDPWADGLLNVRFSLALDPSGGVNPFGPNVVHGAGRYIYNKFAPVPEVTCRATGQTVTVFLMGSTRYPMRHNDLHWDEIRLEAITREYHRTYVLLPPDVTPELAAAVAEYAYTEGGERFTVGASGDDAGIDAAGLLWRRVIAINPEKHPGDLGEFFDTYYPGVTLIKVQVTDPAQVGQAIADALEAS